MRRGWTVRVKARLKEAPVVGLIGPRQCGKTTVARGVARDLRAHGTPVSYFDLEDPRDLARLDSPRLALAPLPGLVILDEVQHKPDLFKILRVLVDKDKRRRFLVLGSASGELMRQTSEPLTGRISYLEMTPFRIPEVSDEPRLWLRGGYPRAYIPAKRSQAFRWLNDYITTFLERDIPAFGLRMSPIALRRAWTMLAHVHGGIFNASELGRSLGVADTTVRHYVDVLTDAFMLRQLAPWYENLGKRQVKSPKVYVRDSGVLHALLGLRSHVDLERHPRMGASFEGFALENTLAAFRSEGRDAFFWATQAGAELDLLLVRGDRRIGFEFKRSDHVSPTKSMHVALSDLRLERLVIVVPGHARFPVRDRMEVCGVSDLSELARSMGG